VTQDFMIVVWIVGIAFVCILFVCWLILPFAVMGMKTLQGQMLAEQRKTNALLEQAERRLSAQNPPTGTPLVNKPNVEKGVWG
jgi:hypothetical protein